MDELEMGFEEPSYVLMKHPAISMECLVEYVRDNQRPECLQQISEGEHMLLPMWRGVWSLDDTDERITSWASSERIANQFAVSGYRAGKPGIKFRTEARVIAMVLHSEESSSWIEYIVLEDN